MSGKRYAAYLSEKVSQRLKAFITQFSTRPKECFKQDSSVQK
jgi:hypothetical protein